MKKPTAVYIRTQGGVSKFVSKAEIERFFKSFGHKVNVVVTDSDAPDTTDWDAVRRAKGG